MWLGKNIHRGEIMKLTPEHLASLLTTYSENPLLGVTERDALKQAAEMIAESNEIKPHLEAEIARLQKERDEAGEELAKETKRKEWFLYRKIVGHECDKQGLGVMSYVIHKDHDLRGELFEAIERIRYIGKRLSDSVIATGRTPDEAIDAAMEAEQ